MRGHFALAWLIGVTTALASCASEPDMTALRVELSHVVMTNDIESIEVVVRDADGLEVGRRTFTQTPEHVLFPMSFGINRRSRATSVDVEVTVLDGALKGLSQRKRYPFTDDKSVDVSFRIDDACMLMDPQAFGDDQGCVDGAVVSFAQQCADEGPQRMCAQTCSACQTVGVTQSACSDDRCVVVECEALGWTLRDPGRCVPNPGNRQLGDIIWENVGAGTWKRGAVFLLDDERTPAIAAVSTTNQMFVVERTSPAEWSERPVVDEDGPLTAPLPILINYQPVTHAPRPLFTSANRNANRRTISVARRESVGAWRATGVSIHTDAQAIASTVDSAEPRIFALHNDGWASCNGGHLVSAAVKPQFTDIAPEMFHFGAYELLFARNDMHIGAYLVDLEHCAWTSIGDVSNAFSSRPGTHVMHATHDRRGNFVVAALATYGGAVLSYAFNAFSRQWRPVATAVSSIGRTGVVASLNEHQTVFSVDSRYDTTLSGIAISARAIEEGGETTVLFRLAENDAGQQSAREMLNTEVAPGDTSAVVDVDGYLHVLLLDAVDSTLHYGTNRPER